jgi:hypothetical protein
VGVLRPDRVGVVVLGGGGGGYREVEVLGVGVLALAVYVGIGLPRLNGDDVSFVIQCAKIERETLFLCASVNSDI